MAKGMIFLSKAGLLIIQVVGDVHVSQDGIQDVVLAGDVALFEVVAIKLAQLVPVSGSHASSELSDQIVKGAIQFLFNHFDKDFALCFGEFLEWVFELSFEFFLQALDVAFAFALFHILGHVLCFLENPDGLGGIGIHNGSVAAVFEIAPIFIAIFERPGGRNRYVVQFCNQDGICLCDESRYDFPIYPQSFFALLCLCL